MEVFPPGLDTSSDIRCYPTVHFDFSGRDPLRKLRKASKRPDAEFFVFCYRNGTKIEPVLMIAQRTTNVSTYFELNTKTIESELALFSVKLMSSNPRVRKTTDDDRFAPCRNMVRFCSLALLPIDRECLIDSMIECTLQTVWFAPYPCIPLVWLG